MHRGKLEWSWPKLNVSCPLTIGADIQSSTEYLVGKFDATVALGRTRRCSQNLGDPGILHAKDSHTINRSEVYSDGDITIPGITILECPGISRRLY